MFPAWSRVHENPYTGMLADAVLADDRVTAVNDAFARDLLGKYDIFHIHWPEHALTKSNPVISSIRAILFLAALAYARIRGAVIVWTLHNDEPHELPHPALWPPMRWLLIRLVSRTLIFARRPEWLPDQVASDDTHHPAYPVEATSRSSNTDGTKTLLSFGHQRPNRDTPRLVELFSLTKQTHPHWRLHITGRPTHNMQEKIEQAIEAAADHRISIELEHLTQQQLSANVAAADVVALPVHSGNASGAVLLSLSHQIPVAATTSPALRELAASIADEWLYLLERDFTMDQLLGVLSWSEDQRNVPPALAQLSEVGRQTVDSYEKAMR